LIPTNQLALESGFTITCRLARAFSEESSIIWARIDITTRTSTFEQLEIAQKRLLKQILELPNRMADIAVYILTGIFPVEAQMLYTASFTVRVHIV
jgi:hypothetical protein